jgi:predicted CoA-binding protein
MVTFKQIDEFISSQPIALVGVSRNPKKFGYTAFKELKEKGMNIIPVNRNASEILGEKAYPDVVSLPADVKGLIIMTPKAETLGVVKDAIKKGIGQIWIQQMSDSKEVLEELKETGVNLITGKCILMFYKPNGIHKFHGKLMKFFGRYPK